MLTLSVSVRGQTEHFLRAPTPLLGVEQEVVDFRE